MTDSFHLLEKNLQYPKVWIIIVFLFFFKWSFIIFISFLINFLIFNYILYSILLCVSFGCKVIRKSCILHSGLPTASSTHPAPSIFILLLSTMFLVLWSVSLWLLCNYQFALLNHFTFFTQPFQLHFPLTAVSLSSVSMSLFLFCSLDPMYKRNHVLFVFLCLTYFI